MIQFYKVCFLYDENTVVKVADEKNQVEYEGNLYSLTGLAKKLLIERNGWSENLHVNGWQFFTKDGKALTDIRDSLESEE